MVERLKGEPGYNVQAIADFVHSTPAVNAAALTGPMKAEAEEPTIAGGVVLRLLIPYPDAEFALAFGRAQPGGVGHGRLPRAPQPGDDRRSGHPTGKVKPFHVVFRQYSSEADRRSGFRAEDWE